MVDNTFYEDDFSLLSLSVAVVTVVMMMVAVGLFLCCYCYSSPHVLKPPKYDEKISDFFT